MVDAGGERRSRVRARVTCILCGTAAIVLACAADRLFGGQAGFGLQQALLAALGCAALVLAFAPAALQRGALVLAVSSGLALASAEGLARLLWRERFTSIYRADPTLLHRLVPGASKTFVHRARNGGRSVRVSIDSRGFRGPEHASSGQGRERIVVFGDSCIAAEYSEHEHSLVGRLAAALGSDYEVLNAGVVGYGPDQVLLLMREELAALAPRLVVVGLFADNDLGDLLRNKLYRVEENGLLVAQPARLDARLASQLRLARSGFVLQRALRRLLARRADEAREQVDGEDPVREQARIEGWLAACRAEYEEAVLRSDPLVHNLFEDHYDADVALEPEAPSSRYKLDLCRAILREMGALARSAGVPLLVLVIPSRLDVCDRPELGWIDPERFPSWQRGRLAEEVAALVREAGLPALELYPAFRAGGDCELYFRGGDSHWNERGQALAATLLVERLRAEGWLD